MSIPTRSEIVIVGGGIVGVSLAYHLAKLGKREVTVLEQGQITCGTTWHAAGLVGQMRPNRSMTRMSRYGIELYRGLEAETGQATGWKTCGSLNVARTAERWTIYQRQAAMARSFGVEVEMLTPEEAGRLYPILRTDDLQGALWFPEDGKANPVDLTQALARGARQQGVKIVEGIRVEGFRLGRGAVVGVETDQGYLECAQLACCAGQWTRALAAKAGVNVPLFSAEHFYWVTETIEGVHPMLPVMRDPDGYLYFKEEVGGLLVGGFEPVAKPWGKHGIPEKFEFQLLPEDWDQVEVLVQNALHRVPVLEQTGVKRQINGPESFTPDGNFILGEAPEVRNFFVAAGFNSAGIANAGGAGRLLAEWMVGGESPGDLFEVDIRRFGPFAANLNWLEGRTVETLGLHYAMRWPRHELESGRPQRRSPLYGLLKSRGACFGSKMGWERANWFAPDGQKPEMVYTLGRPNWLEAVVAEQNAVRQAVGLFDQSSFGKLLVVGRDALGVLQRLCANEMDVPVGQIVYTPMLNARGGYESDITVHRLGREEFFVVTGTAQPTRDLAWIRRHAGENDHLYVLEVTNAWSVLSLFGPRAEALLKRLTAVDLSLEAFPLNSFLELYLGFSNVRAARVSYVGGPGWELYVPVEMAAGLYQTLWEAGADLGLRDCGYYALDALRIEAGRRAFPSELSPDFNPFEAGLGFAVRLDKPSGFVGQSALKAASRTHLTRRLLTFSFPQTELFAWGGEPILRDGKPVGELSSVGYTATQGCMVGLGYVYSSAPETAKEVLASSFELEVSGRVVPAKAGIQAVWKP